MRSFLCSILLGIAALGVVGATAQDAKAWGWRGPVVYSGGYYPAYSGYYPGGYAPGYSSYYSGPRYYSYTPSYYGPYAGGYQSFYAGPSFRTYAAPGFSYYSYSNPVYGNFYTSPYVYPGPVWMP